MGSRPGGEGCLGLCLPDQGGSKMRGQAPHRPEPTETLALETAPPGWSWAGGLRLSPGHMDPAHVVYCRTGLWTPLPAVPAGFGFRMSRNLTVVSGRGSQEQKGLLMVTPQELLCLQPGAAMPHPRMVQPGGLPPALL